MAVAGAKISVEFPELEKLRAGIRNLGDKAAAAQLLGDALYKAVYPAFLRLGEVTPIGPTRNLREAADLKVVTYARSGAAVALFGYRRAGDGPKQSAQGGTIQAGPDRAFHQWWLEFGTKQRVISEPTPPKRYFRSSYVKGGFLRKEHTRIRNGKPVRVRAHPVTAHAVSAHNVTEMKPSYFASSFSELGPFEIQKIRGQRGKFTTNPPIPKAFFKRSSTPIILPAMRPGGQAGLPPVQTAWNQTKGLVAERLQSELRISLEAAVKTLVFRGSGSITGALTSAGG
jgi:hypothetical protein